MVPVILPRLSFFLAAKSGVHLSPPAPSLCFLSNIISKVECLEHPELVFHAVKEGGFGLDTGSYKLDSEAVNVIIFFARRLIR